MEKKKSKISVIVPMYNVDEYIKETLDSLVNQTFTEVEYILIDDNSSDGTFEIASKYVDEFPNITIIRNEFNEGISAVRNQGIDISCGDYIFFLDGDDFLSVDALEIMYNAAIKNDADLITGLHNMYHKNESLLSDVYEQFPGLSTPGIKDIFSTPDLFYLIFCWGKLYKRELVKHVRFPEKINYCEDQPFTVYAYLNAKKIYTVSSVIYFYRQREGQTKSLTQLIYSEQIQSLNNVIKVIKISEQYFYDSKINNEELKFKLLIYYINRVLLWNVWPILASGLAEHNRSNFVKLLGIMNKWISSLDNKYVKEVAGIQVILKEVSKFISSFDSKTLDVFRQLLYNTKEKMAVG